MRFNTRWIAGVLATLALVATVTGTGLLSRATAADDAEQRESDTSPVQGASPESSSDSASQADAPAEPDKDR